MGRTAVKGDSEKPTVQVTKVAKDALVDWLGENHSPKQGIIVGKIIEWFVAQEQEVQQVVLGSVSQRMRPAMAAVLRAMADEIESPERGGLAITRREKTG